MKKRIAIILAEGFEEIEAVIPADLLRRLGFDVTLAGEDDSVCGSHGIVIRSERRLDSLDADELDCLVLPGGMPGSLNLMNSPKVIELVRRMNETGKLLCAICAAPIALARAGVIKGIRITAHPSVKDQLDGAKYGGRNVEEDKKIITGKGPGASFEFACRIAAALGRKSEAETLMKDIFVDPD